jgi:diadenosine tetraphosphate (Ap4A) HIT family hydrolase
MDGVGPSNRRVFEDPHFTVDQSESCTVPGYLVVRLKGAPVALADLGPAAARRVGEMISRAARAIEEVVAPERVYCLAFCELDPSLHFHLFPRTRALLEAYLGATGTSGEPVNGPKLFEWARTAIVPGRPVPDSLAASGEVCAALRRALER